MLRGPTEPKKPFFNLIRRESSSSPSCSEAFSLPTIDESLDEDDRTGDDTSTSSFSFSISPLSFTQRNLDLSYGDLNEDVNLKSFSEDYDDDISTSSAEDSHVTQVHFQDLRRKLQETEKAKRDLLTQCLKLNKRVTSQLQESTTTYMNSLKKENDKLKAENRNMEQHFANDIRSLLNNMSEMDMKMAQRDEKIADLEYELMVIRTEFA
jgi:hypothetical protein